MVGDEKLRRKAYLILLFEYENDRGAERSPAFCLKALRDKRMEGTSVIVHELLSPRLSFS